MKKIIIIFIIICACLFVLSFSKDQIIKSAVSAVGSHLTGAKIEIKGLSLGIIKQTIRISGLKMHNPKGFSNNVLIDLPKAVVSYDLFSLLKGKIHIRYAEMELKEVNLEKNKDGQLNVDALKVSQAKEAKPSKKPAKQPQLEIDELNLKIGRVVSRDYSSGTPPPLVQVYEINLDRKYKNIKGAGQLTALILASALQSAGIKGAAIYSATALAGVALLPVAAGATLFGKDFVQEDINISMNKLYNASLDVLESAGKIKKQDLAQGLISADVNGTSVTVRLKEISSGASEVTVSARKFFLPKPEVAGGILLRIKEKIN